MNKFLEIFIRFLSLGCISFGGPAAHIGYFRKSFVEKLKWMDEKSFGDMLALSQFLPGPGSSQLGFSIGYHRGGIIGAFIAFVAFTFPSFLIMYLLSCSNDYLNQSVLFIGAIKGLKLLAVVVVADAVLKMYGSFCDSKLKKFLAFFCAALVLINTSIWTQFLILVAGGVIGAYFLVGEKKEVAEQKGKINFLALVIFLGVLLLLPIFVMDWKELKLFSEFFQAGSLVFGGGHVVLPMLKSFLGDQVSQDQFLMGYAAAQGVPGPMFSFGTYLGAEILNENKLLGAFIGTCAIFLPGFLLLLGLQHKWKSLSSATRVAGAIAGINAAVVGLLMVAFYNPVFTSAIQSNLDVAVCLLGFYFIRELKVPILFLVLGFIGLGAILNTGMME